MLIDKAINGDKEAFISLIDSYKLTMLRTAHSILDNNEDIADAIQEAIISAYTKLDTLKEKKHFKTWLIRILIFSCYDILRDKKRIVTVDNAQDYESGEEINFDDRLDVHTTLNLLKDSDRILLTLYYLEDLPVKEIAFALGITENAARLRLSRGRERFKEQYEKKEAYNGI